MSCVALRTWMIFILASPVLVNNHQSHIMMASCDNYD